MKLTVSLITCILLTINGFSQEFNFTKEYDNLLENLSTESWDKAQNASSKLLEYAESIDSMQTEQKVLRYIYIYATAGLLSNREISKDEALKQIKPLIGKEMNMPAHPFNSDCYVNCIHLNEENTFFTGVNDRKGTKIFSFEYVKIKEPITETAEQLELKFITLSGILNEVSTEGDIYPRFKLRFIDGSYTVRDF